MSDFEDFDEEFEEGFEPDVDCDLGHSSMSELQQKFFIVEDEMDFYYVLECIECGKESYMSCVTSPEQAVILGCYECKGQLRHKSKEGFEATDEEAWADLYGEEK